MTDPRRVTPGRILDRDILRLAVPSLGALNAGVDGLWLALGIGVLLLAVMLPTSELVIG